MPLAIYAILAAGCLAVFALAGRRAFEMKDKNKYREMWANVTLSVLPGSLLCLWIGCTETMTMAQRNFLLVPAGAILGACAFAYLGYVLAPAAHAQADAPPRNPMTSQNPNETVGTHIEGDSQGGPAAEINAKNAGPGTSVTGFESNVVAPPGQNAVGTRVIQRGPGTGLKVTVTNDGKGGSVTGFRSTVTVGEKPK